MFHESLAATVDMAVLPGVLGCRTLRLLGGKPIFTVSRQQFMKYAGLGKKVGRPYHDKIIIGMRNMKFRNRLDVGDDL